MSSFFGRFYDDGGLDTNSAAGFQRNKASRRSLPRSLQIQAQTLEPPAASDLQQPQNTNKQEQQMEVATLGQHNTALNSSATV